ncbi:hypothetical protein KORDIASMS9_01635 [Kordia sp. SMS9]|uniref:hypothetical protein n=1 Tax=Kordia sp. SMS9 TaxID=2282170 RepID=UPI000E100AED|nr:hypothetical protein [Kordia sp. SMS9]AXG69413.1 hypothetical protein KORDIASMS9_01635 [Kordia sp. SMS9]
MRKKTLKLGLGKLKISNLHNLDTIKAGNGSHSEESTCIESLTFAIDLCCNTDGCGTRGGF